MSCMKLVVADTVPRLRVSCTTAVDVSVRVKVQAEHRGRHFDSGMRLRSGSGMEGVPGRGGGEMEEGESGKLIKRWVLEMGFSLCVR